MKKIIKVVLAAAAVVALAVPAMAADKLKVRNAGNTADVFTVQDSGNTGFNLATPIYAADVVSPGAINKSQLHFSLAGADSGGWITSVAENNFFISSGAVFNGPAGGWIQKASTGQSVFFGSGAAGFRAYLNSGATVGGPVTQNQVMLIDYSGNLTMNGGIQMNNDPSVVIPGCVDGLNGQLFFTKGAAGVKDTLQVCAKDAAGTFAWRTLF